jgi:hypothetical protein
LIKEAAVVPDTIRARLRVWNGLRIFAERHAMDWQDEETAILYAQDSIRSRRVEGFGGTLTLVSRLQSLRKKLELPSKELAEYRSGLTAMNNGIPVKQAVPATDSHMVALLDNLPVEQALIVWMAFKTASRMGEVLKLNTSQIHFRHRDPTRFAIAWGITTKSGRKSPFDFRNFTMVEVRSDELRWSIHLMNMPENSPLTPFPESLAGSQRDKLVRRIRKVCPQLSAHSFKRGAMTKLLPLMKKNGVLPALLPRLLKHKGEAEPVPATTIRYGADPYDVAELGETGVLTLLL